MIECARENQYICISRINTYLDETDIQMTKYVPIFLFSFFCQRMTSSKYKSRRKPCTVNSCYKIVHIKQ